MLSRPSVRLGGWPEAFPLHSTSIGGYLSLSPVSRVHRRRNRRRDSGGPEQDAPGRATVPFAAGAEPPVRGEPKPYRLRPYTDAATWSVREVGERGRAREGSSPPNPRGSTGNVPELEDAVSKILPGLYRAASSRGLLVRDVRGTLPKLRGRRVGVGSRNPSIGFRRRRSEGRGSGRQCPLDAAVTSPGRRGPTSHRWCPSPAVVQQAHEVPR